VAAAIALSIVLVVAVAGMSLALQTQRPMPQVRGRAPTVPRRPSGPARGAGKGRSPTPPPEAAAPAPPPEPKKPELLRSGTKSMAKVLGVVDERTTGTVVRSRLSLKVEPENGEPFEVQIRHAFPTLQARSEVKVGGSVPVRFDPDDHRVVLAPDD
jgi:hypothetical protein